GNDRLPLIEADRSDAARRRQDVCALDNVRPAVFIEERHQGFADAELGDDFFDVERRIGAHRGRGGGNRLLVARRERTQRVLNPVAKLAQHLIRHVERVLRDKIYADSLRADQPHYLLDPVQQRFRRIGKQQVCLVEKKHELRLVAIAHFRQSLVELGQQPEQEGRIQRGRAEQLVRRQDVDNALAAAVGLQQVVDVEHRLADELVGALLLQRQYSPLDRADAGCGNIAVLGLKIARVVADVLEQGAKVLEIEQQQAVVVGDLEREGKHAFLSFVEVQDARKKQRPQVRDGR